MNLGEWDTIQSTVVGFWLSGKSLNLLLVKGHIMIPKK